jgi:hypothetical protein
LVDSTDLIIATSVVQTLVISLTLLVFIFQFRSQEKATKEAAVQNVMGRYTDYIRMLVENPQLAKFLDLAQNDLNPGRAPVEKLSPEDETTMAYLLLGYGIFEEIYSLYKKKWMDEETWQQWSSFIQRMANHPLFRRVHYMTSGTFDKDFQEFVSKLIEESKKASPQTP